MKKRWCIPEVSAEFVWRMGRTFRSSTRSLFDPKRPVVCFDEMPYQMVAEKRSPISARPGYPERYDYEYERRGVCDLFMFFEPKASWRHIDVGERRTAVDFAQQVRRLADEHYPEAEKIRVVLDDLNTHTPAALYEAFEPQEARRIFGKPEFHHTPKHGSWLNQVEVEFSVLSRECIGGRRVPDRGTLEREAGAWERDRNERRATVDWRFGVEDAREELERLYPAKP